MSKKIGMAALILILGIGWQVTAETLAPDADAYIKSDASDTNLGKVTNVGIWKSTSGRKGYFRFDLSEVSDPITSASISLEVQANGGSSVDQTIDVYGLNDGDEGESWSETGITWKNAPQNDTDSFSDLLGNVTLLGQLIIPTGVPAHDRVTFSSEALAVFLAADNDGQATLIFSGTSNTGYYSFYSREVAKAKPELTFE